ncbi:MAG TPA: type VI secretion system tip protein TssI/VgrG, partial [Bryobacteraceae bacterium]|jgi:type VI secretion system secreted protein VgrG|nr:type VI secretion system tip protein TssI/VgrG [Bryobacteraceae bacterium]
MGQFISQEKRLFYFNCPLGPDVLLVSSFSGTEEISELFNFKLELVSEDPAIQTEDLLGKNVTVGIRHRDRTTFRYFNGQLKKFAPLRNEGRLSYYYAEMVPWVWFLTLSNGCHIYQDKTVPQIIDDTFAQFGFSNYDTSGIMEEHKPWENCCQYMESAWDFVSRLMEKEGIYYYFKHEDGNHTLMLVDSMAALQPCPYQDTFRYEHQLGEGEYRTEDTIFSSDLHKHVKPNVYENNDYNFRIPTNKLQDWQQVQRDTGVPVNISRRFYPADVEWPGEPQDYAKLRIEEQEHDHTVAHGASNARAMVPGYRFDLTEHDRAEQNINYLIVKVTHQAEEGTFLPGTNSKPATYTNDYVAHPSSITFRPTLKTEEPRIDSLQTAFVVGPPGEEIYTDEYGRVRVKFFWDLSPGDENGASSCWMRVMQPWAGPNFGHIWIPRVGMEVVVQFLNGDPDRPVITGCVYHAKNMPPYPLPPNKEWSGIKTRSTKGGSEDNYNEIRLVDSIGNELFRMQAEKDLHIFVKNDRCELILDDRFLQVNNDKHEKILNDKYTTVKGNFQEDVEGDVKVKVGGDKSLSVSGDQTEEVEGDKNNTVDGDFAEDIQGDTSIHNEGDYTQAVDGDYNLSVQGDYALDFQGSTSIHYEQKLEQKVDQDAKLTVGADMQIKVSGKLTIESDDDLTIKSGGAFLKISQGQIWIQADKVFLNCGGSAGSAEEANPDDPDDPDDPDTPEDFDNPEDPRFTAPAGDYPLPPDETDTGDPDANPGGQNPDSGSDDPYASSDSGDEEDPTEEGESEDSTDASIDDDESQDDSGDDDGITAGDDGALSKNPWVAPPGEAPPERG